MQQCMKLSLTNRSSGLIPFRLAPPGERTIPSRPVMNIPDALPKGQSCRQDPRRFPNGEPVDKALPCDSFPQGKRRTGGTQTARPFPPGNGRLNTPAIKKNGRSPTTRSPPGISRRQRSHQTRPGSSPVQCTRLCLPGLCLDDLVAMARGQTPDPIPNSAVKTLSADGTAS